MDQIYRLEGGTELTAEVLATFIQKHRDDVAKRFLKLWNAYNNDYVIFTKEKKAQAWKPDHRLAVNFAQFIVDTFEGFFMGNPVAVSSNEEKVSSFLHVLDAYNNLDDTNAELSKTASIFGRAYEIYYTDENAEVCTSVVSPLDGFAVYDDSIKPRMMYFVRLYEDASGMLRGSVSDESRVMYFVEDDKSDAGFRFLPEDETTHNFDGVPAVEFIQNEARRGLFESVLPLIDEYNEALSEKANDVDYFADAYLKVLGAKLDEDSLHFMRTNRVINLAGRADNNLLVDFLQKPNGDTTQEHLLDRLERLIFTIAMVVNISDDNFATSSGIALKYKLLPMSNLAKTKERKFTASLRRRYCTIFSNAVTKMPPDAWLDLSFMFKFNMPVDVRDEAETAGSLSGITSKRTQLSMISAVADVDAELEQIEKEQDPADVGFDLKRTKEE